MARHQQEGLVPFVSKYIDHQEGLARHQEEGPVPFVSKYIYHQGGRLFVTKRRGSSLLLVSNLIISLRRTVRHQEDWLVIFFVSREDGSSITGGDRPFSKFIGHQS
jgi:hypothetical protein